MKLQQYTGPVQAKGHEDTAFYRYNVLLSLNEVGGEPGKFGRSPTDVHHALRERAHREERLDRCTVDVERQPGREEALVADKELMAPGGRPIEIVDGGKIVRRVAFSDPAEALPAVRSWPTS